MAGALTALVAHHDALRSRFKADVGTGLLAEIDAPGDTPEIQVIDCTSNTLEEHCEDLQRSLDLSEGPLIRSAILRLPDGDRLLVVIHHLVVDWVSWRILIADLQRAYDQRRAGDPITLPPRTDSFKDCAEAVTGTADSPDLVREKAWWAALSQGDGLRLPFANIPPDSADLVADARTATVTAPADLTTALLGPANSAYATETVDLLLAGLARAARGLAGA